MKIRMLKIYWKYLKALLRHKWYVLYECMHEGIPIHGFFHDMSKFRPSEFFAYAKHFSGDEEIRTPNLANFSRAWLLHQHRNNHHWEWWTIPRGNGEYKTQPMDQCARTEMLCDWRGAAASYNGAGAKEWYLEHREKIILHPETREWLEDKLGLTEK